MMDQPMGHNQMQACPQCGKHCPVDALGCGRGREYFGAAGQGCGHGQLGGLPGLLHRCGRFVRHAGQGEDELFQALTGGEKDTLQALLEKLCADWEARLGGETPNRCHHGRKDGKGHRHGGRE